jgi:hypothetical protein
MLLLHGCSDGGDHFVRLWECRLGATRIRLLDMLVALALLVGVGVPIVHLTLGWLSRRYARKIGGREDS